MSMDDFKNCMTTQYNLDAEAVGFIVQIFELGGEGLLKDVKKVWESIPDWLKALLGKIAGDNKDKAIKFLQRYGAIGSAAELVIAMILGLGLAAVILALTAGVDCCGEVNK